MTPEEIQKMKDRHDACLDRGNAHHKARRKKRAMMTPAERMRANADAKSSFDPNKLCDIDRPGEEEWT